MAEITKCTARTCPSRNACLRWTAPASEMQSYALFLMQDRDDRCDDFVPNGKR